MAFRIRTAGAAGAAAVSAPTLSYRRCHMTVAVPHVRMHNVSYQNVACNGRCKTLGSDKYLRLPL